MRTSRSLLVAAALALTAGAQARAQLGEQGSPVGWAADHVDIVEAENLIHLTGRVDVTQGDARLIADEMRIFLKPPVPGQNREVERIEADGSVIYTTPVETARGDHGVYVASEDRIRLTGQVRLVRGEDVFCGHELVLQPQRGQFEAVGGPRSDDPMCSGRVRGVISSGGGDDL